MDDDDDVRTVRTGPSSDYADVCIDVYVCEYVHL